MRSHSFLFFLPVFFVACFSVEDNSGKSSYITHCASCHGETGKGFQELIPPLSQSDYTCENADNLACIMKYGIEGELVVNGVVYDQPMAGLLDLSPEEITNILNFLVTDFKVRDKKFNLSEVRTQLSRCQ